MFSKYEKRNGKNKTDAFRKTIMQRRAARVPGAGGEAPTAYFQNNNFEKYFTA
jgi:hypothetical protein